MGPPLLLLSEMSPPFAYVSVLAQGSRGYPSYLCTLMTH